MNIFIPEAHLARIFPNWPKSPPPCCNFERTPRTSPIAGANLVFSSGVSCTPSRTRPWSLAVIRGPWGPPNSGRTAARIPRTERKLSGNVQRELSCAFCRPVRFRSPSIPASSSAGSVRGVWRGSTAVLSDGERVCSIFEI